MCYRNQCDSNMNRDHDGGDVSLLELDVERIFSLDMVPW